MSDDRRERDPGQELRERAESRAAAAPPGELEALGPEAVERLVHELRVHQIELELQNEELRLAQQALEASRARYFELFDLAPVGYFVLGQEGLVQEANLTAAALFGVNRGDLKGRPLSRWIRSVDQDLYYQHRRLLLETQRPQTCELRVAKSDGLELWIRLESTLEQGQLDQPLVCRTTASNVTEERTLRARLAESDRLASMGLIAAGVSHEIANPLTSVLYNLECITGERLDAEEVGELARVALAGATQIKTITRVLGAFSRVDPAERRPVDLREVIEHAIAMAIPRIQRRARLEREHGRVPAVLASSGRLAQVFLNLLLNAAQAIREGSDPEENVIRVRTSVEGDQVLVEVSDTGVGIAEAHRALVFEPFFSTRELGKGTGLGLAVARRLVAEFDGQISFESVVGSGTRFMVRLPAAAAKSADPRTMPSEVPARRDRILVVDDDQAVRRMLERTLGGTLEVVLAPGGEEARTILAGDQRFDLVLLDVMMPGVTGIDLHRWLAEEHPTLAARVVFISGGSFSEEYLGRVSNPLLPKPFDARALVRTVGELVLKARAAESL